METEPEKSEVISGSDDLNEKEMFQLLRTIEAETEALDRDGEWEYGDVIE